MRTIILTFDVEDWFQVENLRSVYPCQTWSSCELRVSRSTHQILDILDNTGSKLITSIGKNSLRPARGEIKTMPEKQCSPRATFFFLGWIAKRLPELVREVHFRGHEVASHGYNHTLLSHMSWTQIHQDLTSSKQLLEDITGHQVLGYRAPSFSINSKHLAILQEAGYVYDSSYNSFALNRRYGRLDVSRWTKNGLSYLINDSFSELPVSNMSVGGKTLPWAGGGYFRLLWPQVFAWGVRRIMRHNGGYIFYMHPWELDAEQPRVKDLPALARFRHYLNLEKTASRLQDFLRAFRSCRFETCGAYVQAPNSKSKIH